MKAGRSPIITVDGEAYTIDGRRYPRLTHVMDKGLPKPWLDKWREKKGVEEAKRIAAETADLGNLIHLTTELSDLQADTQLNELMDREPWLLPYLWAWVEYRDQYIAQVLWVERTVWSDRLRVAGKTDRLVLYKGDSNAAILDIKSTSALHDDMGVQVRGYVEMATERIMAMGLPLWMVPERTIIAHLPGPREVSEDNPVLPESNVVSIHGKDHIMDFERVKIKEYDSKRYVQKLVDCIEQYYALVL
jgi:hypothetical protein